MRNLIILSLATICILHGCKSSPTNWEEQYHLARKESQAYLINEGSEEHFNNAMKIYDDIIKNSSEFRDKAKIGKSTLLANAEKYEEAIKTVEGIDDSSAVFYPFLTKGMVINKILIRKAFMESDSDAMDRYAKENLEELESELNQRRDSLYYAICSGPIDFSNITDVNVCVFFVYLEELRALDYDNFDVIIQSWIDGVPEPNEYSEAFFKDVCAPWIERDKVVMNLTDNNSSSYL